VVSLAISQGNSKPLKQLHPIPVQVRNKTSSLMTKVDRGWNSSNSTSRTKRGVPEDFEGKEATQSATVKKTRAFRTLFSTGWRPRGRAV